MHIYEIFSLNFLFSSYLLSSNFSFNVPKENPIIIQKKALYKTLNFQTMMRLNKLQLQKLDIDLKSIEIFQFYILVKMNSKAERKNIKAGIPRLAAI